MQFFDLHCHMLCGIDDGAKTPEEMLAMLDMAYADGIRAICLTPHYSPYLFGETGASSEKVFASLQRYAAKKYPDLHLFLGHELGYHYEALDALDQKKCRLMAGSRYVLVDFPETVDFFEIKSAMDRLRSTGYFVILAHTERYRCLFGKLDWIRQFVEDGGVVQLNASSARGDWGRGAAKQWKKLVKSHLAHIISTDAHNTDTRPPLMSICVPFLQKYCTPQQFRELTWDNACHVVKDEPI